MLELIEELIKYKDIGIGITSLLIVYSFAKWTADKAFKQVEAANTRAMENQQKFFLFIEGAYKENTETMAKLISTVEEHVKIKDTAIEMLKEQQEELMRMRK